MLFTSVLALLAATASVSAMPKTKCGSAQFGNVFQEQAYPVTTDRLLTVVGQFQVSDWQGLPQVGKSGPDNTKGSTRTVALGSLQLVEEIEKYKSHKHRDTTKTIFFLNNGPVSVANNTITYYRETFVTVPLCDGRASQIQWGVEFCYTQGSNSSVGGLFIGAHTGGLNNVTTQLGVSSFNGDCSTL